MAKAFEGNLAPTWHKIIGSASHPPGKQVARDKDGIVLACDKLRQKYALPFYEIYNGITN